jgi:hypothetical protein
MKVLTTGEKVVGAASAIVLVGGLSQVYAATQPFTKPYRLEVDCQSPQSHEREDSVAYPPGPLDKFEVKSSGRSVSIVSYGGKLALQGHLGRKYKGGEAVADLGDAKLFAGSLERELNGHPVSYILDGSATLTLLCDNTKPIE